jgi:SAM domain (Sterile alpha motif)
MRGNPEFGAPSWTSRFGCGALASNDTKGPSARNEIDERVLPSLTAEDLKEIGIGPFGHRRIILEAIAALRTDTGGKAPSAEAVTTPSAPSAAPEDRAERRQVTVMFSDLVGSMALSARMDPEDLREVISAFQKCVAETVQRFGAFIAKYMGDGVPSTWLCSASSSVSIAHAALDWRSATTQASAPRSATARWSSVSASPRQTEARRAIYIRQSNQTLGATQTQCVRILLCTEKWM